jgi:hypothetical protein
VNECLSAVSTTPAKKEKKFEIKIFKIFYQELSLLHFTPKDLIAYLSFLGVDAGDKHSFENIFANFRKNRNGPKGVLMGPGDGIITFTG